jgi:hypothetical protein
MSQAYRRMGMMARVQRQCDKNYENRLDGWNKLVPEKIVSKSLVNGKEVRKEITLALPPAPVRKVSKFLFR